MKRHVLSLVVVLVRHVDISSIDTIIGLDKNLLTASDPNALARANVVVI